MNIFNLSETGTKFGLHIVSDACHALFILRFYGQVNTIKVISSQWNRVVLALVFRPCLVVSAKMKFGGSFRPDFFLSLLSKVE